MSIALVLIDIQNDYFPGGAMELVASPEAANQAAKVLAAFRDKGLPVVHIQHISLRPVIQKHFPNSFRETSLLDHLREKKISRLAIAGMMTHMCVDTTTRAAADLGFACTLAHDACATRALSFNDAQVSAGDVQLSYLAALNGSFAKVVSANELVSDL